MKSDPYFCQEIHALPIFVLIAFQYNYYIIVFKTGSFGMEVERDTLSVRNKNIRISVDSEDRHNKHNYICYLNQCDHDDLKKRK